MVCLSRPRGKHIHQLELWTLKGLLRQSNVIYFPRIVSGSRWGRRLCSRPSPPASPLPSLPVFIEAYSTWSTPPLPFSLSKIQEQNSQISDKISSENWDGGTPPGGVPLSHKNLRLSGSRRMVLGCAVSSATMWQNTKGGVETIVLFFSFLSFSNPWMMTDSDWLWLDQLRILFPYCVTILESSGIIDLNSPLPPPNAISGPWIVFDKCGRNNSPFLFVLLSFI